MTQKTGAAGKIADFFIDSKLTPLIIIASILLGIAAVIALPREEEPQIIVPMVDIFVSMPGAISGCQCDLMLSEPELPRHKLRALAKFTFNV